MLIPDFDKALAFHMQKRGMTPEMLARQVGCTTQLIRLLLEGKTRPSHGVFVRIAECFDQTPNQFLDWH